MGITADKVIDTVNVELEYPHLYPGELFTFKFLIPTKAERDQIKQKGLGQPSAQRDRSETTKALDVLEVLIRAEPGGFDDFPVDDRPIGERAREYFSKPRLEAFAIDAIREFGKIVSPDESGLSFRS